MLTLTNPEIALMNLDTKSLPVNVFQRYDTVSYCDNVVYTNGRLTRILNDVGYMSCDTAGRYRYHYFLKDHEGNVRVVADGNGNKEQVNHYYPFGSLFTEGMNANMQPYKYNGKELERMNGIDWYNYGARHYDATIGRWMTLDPLCEKYYSISPYAYCANNPGLCVDPDGRKIVFVNGFLGFGSPSGGPSYWNGSNSSFVKMAQATFKDFSAPYFTNYDFSYLLSASIVREGLGYNYAKDNYKALTKGMKPGVDKFNFVSHSMGGAFSEGMIRYLSEQGWVTENAIFLNAWEPKQIASKKENTRIDATCINDPVQLLSIPLKDSPDIPTSDKTIRIKSKESIWNIHRDLIDENCNYLWKSINELLSK